MSAFVGFVQFSRNDDRERLVARCRAIIESDFAGNGCLAIDDAEFFVAFPETPATTNEPDALLLGDVIARNCSSSSMDLAAVRSALADGEVTAQRLFSSARGNFSAVFWDRLCKTAHFVTDYLATRPIFYSISGDRLLFASKLKYICQVADGLDIDKDGLFEHAAFGYSLGNATPYKNVNAAEAAQILTFTPSGLKTALYWDWKRDNVAMDRSADSAAGKVYEAFEAAVNVRAARRGADYCLLSGGMDSRAIAFTLAKRGFAPTTLSFGQEDSYDMVIANRLRAFLPGRHVNRPIAANAIATLGGYGKVTFQALVDAGAGRETRWIWSGDGGSVGLGGVYMTKATCLDCAAGRLDQAAANFVAARSLGLSKVAVLSEGRPADFASRRMALELAGFDASIGEQILYRFLLLNDQRRHLYDHYEAIGSGDVELITPFFDAEVLKAVLSAPALDVPLHHLYNKFFKLLPAAARSVPWQTYPGHEPCPLPPTSGIEQWRLPPGHADKSRAQSDSFRMLAAAMTPGWPVALVNRMPVVIASLASILGMRRWNYIVSQALIIVEHYSASRSRSA